MGCSHCCKQLWPAEVALNPLKLSSADEACDSVPASTGSLDKRIEQLKSLQQFDRLQLTVLSACHLPKNTQLLIEPLGIHGALRGFYDGSVYFGTKKKANNVIVNDYVIPLDGETPRGPHFMISYSLETSSYWIRDLAKGYGLFLKLEHPLQLKPHMLLSFGQSFVRTSISSNETLTLSILSPTVEVCKDFAAQEWTDRWLKLGRTADMKVCDPLISKVQCSLSYSELSGWSLVDGDGERGSTNGSWLYLEQELEIYSGMIFKFHDTIIQAMLA